jgi:hypothetical protein
MCGEEIEHYGQDPSDLEDTFVFSCDFSLVKIDVDGVDNTVKEMIFLNIRNEVGGPQIGQGLDQKLDKVKDYVLNAGRCDHMVDEVEEESIGP